MSMGRLSNTNWELGPRAVDPSKVWPKERAHLLHEDYCYEVVSVLIKNGWSASESMLRIHYPSLIADPHVLFVDTGDHVVIYYCELVDKAAV